MKTAVLMIILSMLENGQMSSAFVNTPSMTSCQQRSKIVRAILTSGKVDIREIKCVPSSLKFTKFDHKTAEKAPRFLYSVKLGESDATVTALEELGTCKSEQAAVQAGDSARLFCTSSTQELKTK